ncbi:MAG: nitrile hydratase subunit beta [Amaricoccus sp.]
MNGPQDLGGQMGFGPVAPEPDEPVFHADWERRALAVTLAAGAMGAWPVDAARHARESLPPAVYLGSSYYEIWIRALERLLVAKGFLTGAELVAGRALAPAPGPKRVLKAGEVRATIARGSPYERDPGGLAPAFARGHPVRTRVMHPRGHTRLPRYARGKLGRVEAVQGFHVLPDANAHGHGEAPEWLYTVVFPARELWGEDGDANGTVSIDAWESYLEPA